MNQVAVIDALALLELEKIRVDEAAALAGITTAELAAKLDDYEIVSAICARATQMRLDGEALELTALSMMPSAIERLRDLPGFLGPRIS
ncbi:hypothetical protein [Rudaea sp.]|uniref:hypothetical protein n=1 Tax=Rudaea sp. TaxID=2136325 RepID=UPI0037848506